MEEQRKEDEVLESQFDNEDDDDDFDPFLHATVPRNLYHKFQTEGSKRWGPPTEILPFLFLGSCFCANEEALLRDLGVDHILNVAEECPPPPTVASRKDKGEKLVKHYMMVDVVEHIRKSENQWNTFESCFNFIDKARVAYEAKYGGGKKRKGSKRMKRPGEERGERKSSGMKIKKLSLRTGKDRDKERETTTSAATGDAASTGSASDKVLVHCMHGRSRSATIVLAYLMKKEGWTLRQAYVHVKLRRPIVGPDKYLKHQLIEYEQHLFGKSSFQNVEEFRDYQLLLTPELVLKEKERKQKLKEEEARQQEQSCSSNDDNTTKLDDVEQQADADEEEPSGKEITADGEVGPGGETLEGDDAEEEVSSSPRTPSAGATTGDDEEGKGSGKKKKKKKKKNKKASGDEESTEGTNGDEKMAAVKKAKKSKKKDKAAGGTPLVKRKAKKRQEGGTSSSGGSAAGSPRSDDVTGVNNEEPRKRANSASSPTTQAITGGGRASRSNTATNQEVA